MRARKYVKEVESVARSLIEEALAQYGNAEDAREAIQDDILRETIDGHEFVIYTEYHLDVLEHSGNEEALILNFGEEYAVELLRKGGLGGIRQAQVFWAMYYDTLEYIEDILEEYEEGEND